MCPSYLIEDQLVEEQDQSVPLKPVSALLQQKRTSQYFIAHSRSSLQKSTLLHLQSPILFFHAQIQLLTIKCSVSCTANKGSFLPLRSTGLVALQPYCCPGSNPLFCCLLFYQDCVWIPSKPVKTSTREKENAFSQQTERIFDITSLVRLSRLKAK